eukprot:1327604-Amphidinium_carterae.3
MRLHVLMVFRLWYRIQTSGIAEAAQKCIGVLLEPRVKRMHRTSVPGNSLGSRSDEPTNNYIIPTISFQQVASTRRALSILVGRKANVATVSH